MREVPDMEKRTEAARVAARQMYGTDDIEIDAGAHVSHLDEIGTEVENWAWVAAWVLVPAEKIDEALA